MATDPKYTSTYTGQQVDSAVAKALPLDTFASATNETIGGVTYHVLWKVAPTASNTVRGITVHPTTGAFYIVTSTNGTKTVDKSAVKIVSNTTNTGVEYIQIVSFDSSTGTLNLTKKYLHLE